MTTPADAFGRLKVLGTRIRVMMFANDVFLLIAGVTSLLCSFYGTAFLHYAFALVDIGLRIFTFLTATVNKAQRQVSVFCSEASRSIRRLHHFVLRVMKLR